MSQQTLDTEKCLKGLGVKHQVLGRNINGEFVEILVDKEDILKALAALRKNPNLRCNNLHCMTGVDYPETGYIEIVYHLYSYNLGHKIVIKTRLERENPTIESAFSLWKTADWQEREIYELFGVEFIGHPNLRNLLLNDDFPGHPYRRDVPLKNDEEWLLEDDAAAKDFGIPVDLNELYKKRLIEDNGGKTK